MNYFYKIKGIIFYFIIFIIVLPCSAKPSNSKNYLGQTSPGLEPQRFAKDILFSVINENKHEELHSSIFFAPDSKEIYYTMQTRSKATGKYKQNIMMLKFKNGNWSKPKIAPFSGEYSDTFLNFSTDGKTIYFKSDRPAKISEDENKGKIWFVEKKNNEWSKPIFMGSFIEDYPKVGNPSFMSNGDMYFKKSFPRNEGSGEILVSRNIQGKYTEPVKLSSSINSNHYENFPNVSPEEDFLIFYRMIPGGESGQYISFKNKSRKWSEAISMGKSINGGGIAFSTSFSPDRKYIFYLLRNGNMTEGSKREEGIYWISSEILKDLKK